MTLIYKISLMSIKHKKYIDKTYPIVNIYYILYYVLVTHTSIK